MYKKYVTNGSFRNLVRPVMASGIDFNRAESVELNRASLEPQKKKCCKWGNDYKFLFIFRYSKEEG